MPADLIAAFVLFAFVMSATPGPNVMLVAASGVNHGFRATIPHMLGIAIGFSAMLLAVGFGLTRIFDAVPALQTGLKALSIVYLLWLAWKIAATRPSAAGTSAGDARPMTFLQGAAFQWVNPKAWSICLSVIAAYAVPAAFGTSMVVMAGLFVVINLISLVIWAGFGVSLRRLLGSARRVRMFNVAMAILLVASLWPMVADLVSATPMR